LALFLMHGCLVPGGVQMSRSDGGRAELSLVVIDGQSVVHAGIELWATGSSPPIKIVGSYSDPAEFSALRPQRAPNIDVVLFTLEYAKGCPRFDALRQLSRAGHRVVVYSSLVNDEIILRSLDAGAVSYVTKWESGSHVKNAIYAAASDTPYAPPRMAQALLRAETIGRPRLTGREREVLAAWCQTGNKELVGERLFIGPTTVRTHLQRVRAKYAAVGRPAPTKSALLARAVEDGILSLSDL
jgi:DNA-binding NarL/FixJ family response regulator